MGPLLLLRGKTAVCGSSVVVAVEREDVVVTGCGLRDCAWVQVLLLLLRGKTCVRGSNRVLLARLCAWVQCCCCC